MTLTFAPSTARAHEGACPDTPVDWDSYGCAVDGTNVCVINPSGTVWTCDISPATDDGTEIYVVDNFETSTYTYEAWGILNSTPYCCHIQNEYPGLITVEGSVYSDTISFVWASATYHIGHAFGYVDPIEAEAWGDADADTIYGSTCDEDYAEWLYGEAGNDTIFGYAGDDYLDGGAANDTLAGGTGIDTMFGGTGSDTMIGGAGADDMCGASTCDGTTADGGDFMNGSEGADTINGGLGADVICGDNVGGTNADTLNDGDDDDEGEVHDVLWGATSADTETCGDDSTTWDALGTDGGLCGGTEPSRPDLCP